MRTTLKLDDDALALAQAYAKVRCWPLGEAVSELIRRASAPPVGLKKKGDLEGADLGVQAFLVNLESDEQEKPAAE
jgi:hypothetical protein